VSSVVFANQQDGWLSGPGLWSTHDGGAQWHRVSLGGSVRGVNATSGTVYAVAALNGNRLFSSPVGQDAWARVSGVPTTLSVLTTFGRAAWFGSNTQIWATSDGVRWHRYPFGCPGGDYSAKDYGGLASIAAANVSDVLFLCTGDSGMGSTAKELLSSRNGGRTTTLVGLTPFEGIGGVIAVPPGRSMIVTLAAASGASYLHRSANGGKTWVTEAFDSGGMPFSTLSYVNRTVGVGVLVDNNLLRTTDAGLTWHKVSF
jgi:hypothetical protein